MGFTFDALFGKKEKSAKPEKLHPSTAKSVLRFVALGLTDGVKGITASYRPNSKVVEFVAVSKNLLEALKRLHDEKNADDAVNISVHVNGMQKHIVIRQLGPDVLLSLDDCVVIISLSNLTQLYAGLRNDIVRHGEIYGEALQTLAASYPIAHR